MVLTTRVRTSYDRSRERTPRLTNSKTPRVLIAIATPIRICALETSHNIADGFTSWRISSRIRDGVASAVVLVVKDAVIVSTKTDGTWREGAVARAVAGIPFGAAGAGHVAAEGIALV